MSKVDSSAIAALKALFTTGSTLLETNFADLIDAIADAAEDHQHVSTGGAGSGTGDAGPVINLQSGTAVEKPSTPAVGDIYVETDTSKVYACYTTGNWTEVGAGEPGAPADATYVTVNAEAGLSAETQHVNLTGANLHDPKPHKTSHASGGSDKLKYTRQVIFVLFDDPVATGTDKSATIVYRGPTLTLVQWDFRAKTAPVGAAMIADVNVGGTSLWATTQANRPTIANGATSGTGTSFDTTTLSDGDVLTFDIDQIGSTTAGGQITLLIEGEANLETD